MGKIFLGYWNCDSCGKQMIKGNIKNCPNCGRRVNPKTKYIVGNKREYISKEEQKHINKNPDWLCEHCNQYNSDDDTSCVSCGAPRYKSSLNYFEVRKKEEEKIRKTLNKQYENEANKNEVNENTNVKKSNTLINTNMIKKVLFGMLFFAIFIFCIILLVKLFTPKEEVLTVDSFEWCYSIGIEKLETFNESDWELPKGARLKYEQQEEYGKKKVFDKFVECKREVQKSRIVDYKEVETGNVIDLGNGLFEEETKKEPIYEYYTDYETYQEPVYKEVTIYKTKYYYEIDKWVFDREEVTEGKDKNPYWGKVSLSSDEKISYKEERYFIYYKDKKGKRKKVSLNFEDWSYVEQGNTYTFKVNIFGMATLVR